MFFSLHTCLIRVKIWNQIIEPKEGKKVTGLLGRFTSQSRTFFRSKTKMVESTKHLKSSCWPTIDHVAHHMGQSVKKKKKKGISHYQQLIRTQAFFLSSLEYQPGTEQLWYSTCPIRDGHVDFSKNWICKPSCCRCSIAYRLLFANHVRSCSISP